MAEKAKTTKTEKIEREYVIPLREKCRPVPRYKKTPKAIKSMKEFLVKHMKIRDRDLKKIKIDKYLNEQVWERGIKKPLHKVKVKVVKEGDIVRVYAADLPKKLGFKKAREERKEKAAVEKASEIKESKKSMMEKATEGLKSQKKESTDKDKDGVKDKVEEAEKKEAVEEVAKKESKEKAKALKKTTKVKHEGQPAEQVSEK